jgi:hypothetical protein
MLKLVLIAFLPFLFFFGDASDTVTDSKTSDATTGTLKKMVPDSGTVTMSIDLVGVVKGIRTPNRDLVLSVGRDAFMEILVFDGELRSPLPGSVPLTGNVKNLTRNVKTSGSDRLVLEKTDWGSDHEMIIRDDAGNTLFNIEGAEYDFNADESRFGFQNARLLLSNSYAKELGASSSAGRVVGTISFQAEMRTVEVTNVVDGVVESARLPGMPEAGSVPGPDVIVGELLTVEQPSAASGGYVGLGIGTTSCNLGTVDLDWFSLGSGSNDHPVIPQNLYRMSGGPSNNERFEQIGQSWLKHAFTALTENACSLGCNGVGGTHLGSGCSDPYTASLNYSQTSLGSRAWVNPFTGAFPVSPSPANHSGHTHVGPSHRVMVATNDLLAAQNPGATYWAEAQYVTPHEYVWCQTHPTQCNMYNNVSYKQYNVSGSTTFSFAAASSTQRQKPAITAWGATLVPIEPAPGLDGIGTVGYKVTNPSTGVWHYEYAIYNQNLDRGIQSFGLPLGAPVTLTNVGFHAPPQQPAFANDGTFNSAGYSSTPWSSVRNAGDFVWSTETFAQNQNANAIRWGTLYNFRFDANYPPRARRVTIGFFKTGAPITVMIDVPTAMVTVSGRVLNGERGIANAHVTVSDGNGFSATAIADRFGNYHVDNIPAGGMYTVTAIQRRFNFDTQTIAVNDNVSSVDFIPAQ